MRGEQCGFDFRVVPVVSTGIGIGCTRRLGTTVATMSGYISRQCGFDFRVVPVVSTGFFLGVLVAHDGWGQPLPQ